MPNVFKVKNMISHINFTPRFPMLKAWLGLSLASNFAPSPSSLLRAQQRLGDALDRVADAALAPAANMLQPDAPQQQRSNFAERHMVRRRRSAHSFRRAWFRVGVLAVNQALARAATSNIGVTCSPARLYLQGARSLRGSKRR
jgi:hypothetical protein